MLTAQIKSTLGACLIEGGVHFRVWAPKAQRIDVMTESGAFEMEPQGDGYFSAFIEGLPAGGLYKYRINGKDDFPDPCSRFQPRGPHGPSMVVDNSIYQWNDHTWQQKGLRMEGQILYELHVGTFTPQGTYRAIVEKLPHLKELGISVIELMPLSQCPGRWNWGYDGVNLFAPSCIYGPPDDLKFLIDQCHQQGIGVIHDVVYNHLGPDGNYLGQFSGHYFTDKYKNEWGKAINYDGPNSRPVREFFIQNACHWIEEFHFDGLRLDATQNIYDDSPTHILAEMSKILREKSAPKNILLIGENESQHVEMLEPLKEGGNGLDALWCDDFHHSARVAMTGLREAYYTDYCGKSQEFISLIKHGYLYQGQFYSWQKQNRGTFVDDEVPAKSFVIYLQNHDQVANSLTGARLTDFVDLKTYRAMAALMLLAPQTPMLFMGQEFAAASPFLYFVDHNQQLAPLVFKGRREFLSQFPSIASAANTLKDPNTPEAFQQSKIRWEDKEKNRSMFDFHRDLIKLRCQDPVFSQQNRRKIDGAVCNDHAFLIRYKGKGEDRLLIVNLGAQFNFTPCPQPYLAPLPGRQWRLIWGSEATHYGGSGIVPALEEMQWHMPPHSAQVFAC